MDKKAIAEFNRVAGGELTLPVKKPAPKPSSWKEDMKRIANTQKPAVIKTVKYPVM